MAERVFIHYRSISREAGDMEQGAEHIMASPRNAEGNRYQGLDLSTELQDLLVSGANLGKSSLVPVQLELLERLLGTIEALRMEAEFLSLKCAFEQDEAHLQTRSNIDVSK